MNWSGMTEDERFWSRVEMDTNGGCWLWSGHVDKPTKSNPRVLPYGRIRRSGGRPVRAHIFSYEKHKGPIPDGMKVMHSCDIPQCVNPNHLSLGTQGDNNKDRHSKGRTRTTPRPGELHHNSKLTWKDVRAIRASSMGATEISKAYGISTSQVLRILKMERWREADQ